MAPKQKQPCYVLGVGMTKFIKPRGKGRLVKNTQGLYSIKV